MAMRMKYFASPAAGGIHITDVAITADFHGQGSYSVSGMSASSMGDPHVICEPPSDSITEMGSIPSSHSSVIRAYDVQSVRSKNSVMGVSCRSFWRHVSLPFPEYVPTIIEKAHLGAR